MPEVWGGTAHLEEEMRIGMFEGPDEYMLGNVRSMAVADAGEIYLFDSRWCGTHRTAHDVAGKFVISVRSLP